MTTHEKKGWVTKEGGKKGSNSWKQRWMVTEDNGLSYYKKEDQSKRCGSIDLKSAVAVRAADHKKKPNVFEIVCPDRIWVISCAKTHDRNSWVEVISKIITELNPTKKRTMTMEPGVLSRQLSVTRTPRSGEEASAGESPPLSSPSKRKFKPNFRQSLNVNTHAGFEDSQDTSLSEDCGRKPSGSVTSALDSSVKAAKEKVKKVKEFKSSLERTALKKQAILNGSPIGQLFVSVLAAQFDNPIDAHAKPFVEVYFERQMIESGTSKNSANPHWKDNFRFEVASLESRMKLKIFDRVKNSGAELAFVKIPIRPLEDQKQHKQWYDLQGEFPGKVHLSWRYQSKAEKKEDDTDVFMEQGEVVGTAMLTIIGARSLKDRPSTGAPPNPRVVITYGQSVEYITETVQGSNNPEWNYGCILRIRNNSTTSCLIRVEDMDTVQHAHLGTVIASHEMILNSALSEEPTTRWVKLKIDTSDDLTDNRVGGELHIKYRYKPVNAMQKLVEERIEQILNPAEEISINYDDIPEGFPEPPPKVTEFLGSTQEQYKEWMKLKLLRQSWESALHLYRRKEKSGDADGMAHVIEQFRKERKAAVPEAKGVRRGGEVQLGTKRELLGGSLTSVHHNKSPSTSPRRAQSLKVPRTPQRRSYTSELNPFDDEGQVETEVEGDADTDADGATSSIEDAKPRDVRGGFHGGTVGRSETTSSGEKDSGNRTPSRAKPTPTKAPPTAGNPFDEEDETVSEGRLSNNKKTGAVVGSGAGTVAVAETRLSNKNAGAAAVGTGSGTSEGNPFGDDDDDDGVGNPFGNEPSEQDWFSSTHETSPDSLHDLLYKVIIVGDSGVGKTSILWRWMSDKFQVKGATINVEFYVKSFKVSEQVIKIQLWDTAGQEQYRSVTRSYYRNARGAILVYDVTKSESFSYLMSWLNDIREAPGNDQTQILLVGNKTDLVSDREVTTEQGLQFAQAHGLSYMETSAMTGDNVDKAFRIVLSDIHKLTHKQLEQPKTTSDSEPVTGGIVIGDNVPVDTGSCCSSTDFDSLSNSFKTMTNSWFG